jgi:hypothetical protein
MRNLGAILLLALNVGCSELAEPQLGREFRLHVGENVVLADIGLWVAFIGVSQDSRCPLQAMCVWAGDAAVMVETAPFPDAVAADSRTDTLHTNLEPKGLPLGAVELILVRLDPYPETPSSIPVDDYVVTLEARRAQQ